MLNSLSQETQLILMVIAIGILFALVTWNTKRNKKKLYNRDERNFRKNYSKKKSRK
ncbi:hypothetical protein [Aquimarina sp. I32.4]|uniref:hypothetical protein n=1 Tax=Aquimarina sp. I32.4 TaxID=2053903 RepID=UPI001304C03A|nr:hypothetical protein [Aquimarina sp. I32.4]